MTRSETVGKLAEALALAQGEMEGAAKDAENPHFRSRYATLASVVDAIKGPLSRHGIAYVQTMAPSEQQEVVVITTLMHTSGEWISSTLALPVVKNDAQGFGSGVSYARRYSLAAICGVAPEDDDGNAATKAAPGAQTAQDAPNPFAARKLPAAMTTNAVMAVASQVDDRHGAGTARAVRLGIFPDSRSVATLNANQQEELRVALQERLEQPRAQAGEATGGQDLGSEAGEKGAEPPGALPGAEPPTPIDVRKRRG